MKTKIAKCPNCCPDGGAVLEATYHDHIHNVVPDIINGKDYGTKLESVDLEHSEPVWACCNCGWCGRRRVAKHSPEEGGTLTKSQINAITSIQRYKKDRGDREIKRFKLNTVDGKAYVSLTVGTKGDEGTMASVLCRERGHFIVGRRGGIKAVGRRDDTPKELLAKYPLIYGWST